MTGLWSYLDSMKWGISVRESNETAVFFLEVLKLNTRLKEHDIRKSFYLN